MHKGKARPEENIFPLFIELKMEIWFSKFPELQVYNM